MATKINDIVLRTISLFTEGYSNNYYIREAQRKLNTSSRTAQITLDQLERNGILKATTRGKIKTYELTNTTKAREHIIMAEQHKRIIFQEQQTVAEAIEQANKHIQGISIIYGSYSKGTQKKDSDLDLFIIGTGNKQKIRETGKKYGITINTIIYPEDLYEKNQHEDILIQEIKKNQIVMKGTEEFVKKTRKWTN